MRRWAALLADCDVPGREPRSLVPLAGKGPSSRLHSGQWFSRLRFYLAEPDPCRPVAWRRMDCLRRGPRLGDAPTLQGSLTAGRITGRRQTRCRKQWFFLTEFRM